MIRNNINKNEMCKIQLRSRYQSALPVSGLPFSRGNTTTDPGVGRVVGATISPRFLTRSTATWIRRTNLHLSPIMCCSNHRLLAELKIIQWMNIQITINCDYVSSRNIHIYFL